MKTVRWERLAVENENDVVEIEDEEGEKFKMGTVMDTGSGLFMLNDLLHPLRQYNMWLVHTDFWVTEAHFNTLKYLEGVEVIQIVSPYRILIAPGRLFDEDRFKKNVEAALGILSNEMSKIFSGINDLKEELKSGFAEWAIYVFPNGQYEHVTGKAQDYSSRLELFTECERLSSGMLITHDMDQM